MHTSANTFEDQGQRPNSISYNDHLSLTYNMRYIGNIYNIYKHITRRVHTSTSTFEYQGQVEGPEGQGPKFNHFYSRQRQNLSEISNNIATKLWS